ncbi:MAG: putative two-component regulator sensor histidine kinase protein [Rhizobium sp.]|nr:putative two-component regulator sensor histidine kinase protein [Rhizobium sp.]
MLRLVPSSDIAPEILGTVPEEDLTDLYDNAPCGYLSLLPDGRIYMVNATFLGWTGYTRERLVGTLMRDLLNIGAQIFYETHFAPLLRMQGFFNEVALDVTRADGSRLPVLANAVERRDAEGKLLFTRVSLFQAGERRRYERELVEVQAATEAARKELANVNAVLEERVQQLVEERRNAEGSLLREKETAELREHFIAVLGHDLRNPLASVQSGIRMLSKEHLSDRSKSVLTLMDGSVGRMAALISDVMDFARARLGGGLGLNRLTSQALEREVSQVISELRESRPGREIQVEIGLAAPVMCDPVRIGQMVSNLLGNALTHGAEDQPVRFCAWSDAEVLEISVGNAGTPIPTEIQERLFQPFYRGEPSARKEGLGLGLYIAAEIAKAHGGRLTVISDVDETRFTFRMPAGKDPR